MLLSVAVFAVGCAATTDGPEASEIPASSSDDLTAQAAVSVLDGTFDLKGSTNQTPFHSVTLKADHSFTAAGGCPQTGSGVHCFAIVAIHGTWKTAKSAPLAGAPNGAAELELTDQSGQVTTYFYSLKNDELSLSKTFKGTASLFDKNLDHLPKLKMMDLCADKFNNTLGFCPDDFPCEQDGPTGNTQRCLPPI